MVPEWTVVSDITEKPGPASPADLIDCAPRFRIVEAERRAPNRLQGVSRFVRAHNCCRCTVSTNTPFVYKKLDKALSSASEWLGKLDQEFGEYSGTVGESQFMLSLLQNMAVAFDWQYFLQRQGPVQKKHVDSFDHVLQAMMPSLQRPRVF